MSRTYRRKKDSGTMHDWSYRLSVYKILGKTESEVTKLKSVFYSDSYGCSFKEPGPSWFRNLYTERPTRRYNREELRKFMLDNEYEPMCVVKPKLLYWT